MAFWLSGRYFVADNRFSNKVNLSIQKRGSAGKLADRSIVKGTEQGSMCLLAVLKSATCL